MEWKLGEEPAFLRTLDLVRRYGTADGVFIQLGVVGAEVGASGTRLEVEEVQGRCRRAGPQTEETKHRANDVIRSQIKPVKLIRELALDGSEALLCHGGIGALPISHPSDFDLMCFSVQNSCCNVCVYI